MSNAEFFAELQAKIDCMSAAQKRRRIVALSRKSERKSELILREVLEMTAIIHAVSVIRASELVLDSLASGKLQMQDGHHQVIPAAAFRRGYPH